MKDNMLKSKSLAIAVQVVKLIQYLEEHKKESVMVNQLLRSVTSAGIMISEAEYQETNHDFNHKMGMALKEMNISIYWLELLRDTDDLTKAQFESINADAIEIIKLITAALNKDLNQH